jgi:hypothetical protein
MPMRMYGKHQRAHESRVQQLVGVSVLLILLLYLLFVVYQVVT